MMQKDPEADQTLDILQSIRKHGLTIPQTCSVRGALKSQEQKHLFCHNQVNLVSGKEDAACDALSYHEKEGMLAISLERKFEHCSPLEISLSAFNSIVFIFKVDKLYQTDLNCGQLATPMDELMMVDLPGKAVQSGLFQEVRRTNGAAKPEDIFAIMVPYHFVRQVKDIFSDVKIIPVSATDKKVIEDPIEIFAKGGQSIRNTNITCPNYANGLRLFRKAFPSVKQFGVHLTRLPKWRPIAALTEPSSYAKNYNDQYMKSLSLSKLLPDQYPFIKENALFFTFPGDGPRNLRVYCHLNDYPYLCQLVTKFPKLEQAATMCQQRVRQKIASGFFQSAVESPRSEIHQEDRDLTLNK